MTAQPHRPDRHRQGGTVVGVHEAKLLARVANGEVITISRNGTPVAQLSPAVRPGITLGTMSGLISWDPNTFDEPDPLLVASMENGPI